MVDHHSSSGGTGVGAPRRGETPIAVCAEHGVAAIGRQNWSDFGIEQIALELRWFTEPGWLMLELDRPVLCLMTNEIGGRCEFGPDTDRSVEGAYFGLGALAFATANSRLAVRAADMRRARLCCFALDPARADYLSSVEQAAIGRLPSRYMFRNHTISACATLLHDDRVRGGTSAVYIRSLSKALYAAILEMEKSIQRKPAGGLTGAKWRTIARYIRDHSSEQITGETLAEIAEIPVERFGKEFRNTTDMSVRQWLMDHRVRSAQRLLIDNPSESLAEVAHLCGFADQSHFSRAFLKVIGLTPTAWLRTLT